jgi:hypothetical protein
VNVIHGPHQSAQKYTPIDVHPARTVPVGMTLPVGMNRSKDVYLCLLCTESTGPKIFNQWSPETFTVVEGDGPRPPGAAAGVTCQDAAAPFLMVAVAVLIASLIVAC